jgi:RNA polymerase sigma-70 factor, ECF subfamily
MSSRISVKKPERASHEAHDNVIRLPLVQSDAALVACARRDPARGLMLLFDHYSADVERILSRIFGPSAEVEQILYDVFIAAISSIHELRDENALKSWLTNIAAQKAHRRIRKRKLQRLMSWVVPLERLNHTTEPSREISAVVRRSYQLLWRLPAAEHIAFALRQLEGMDLFGIALVTSASISTVKHRLTCAQRAFVTLAQRDAELVEWLARGTLPR